MVQRRAHAFTVSARCFSTRGHGAAL